MMTLHEALILLVTTCLVSTSLGMSIPELSYNKPKQRDLAIVAPPFVGYPPFLLPVFLDQGAAGGPGAPLYPPGLKGIQQAGEGGTGTTTAGGAEAPVGEGAGTVSAPAGGLGTVGPRPGVSIGGTTVYLLEVQVASSRPAELVALLQRQAKSAYLAILAKVAPRATLQAELLVNHESEGECQGPGSGGSQALLLQAPVDLLNPFCSWVELLSST